MTLHPLAERFAEVAGAYERGRPGYPPAVAGAIAAELGIASGAPVLDLGAGTGKLARVLLAYGFDVVAVEPQEPLRELLADAIGAERALPGVAEAIPLADSSVALVTVADAFHWFDQQKTLREIKRVLRPGGGLAVLATAPDLSGAPWVQELGKLMEEARPEHPYFDGPPWQDALRAAGGFSEPWTIRVSSTQATDQARVADYLASVSWVAALAPQERAAMMERIAAVVDGGETPSEIVVHAEIGLSALA